MRRLPLVIDRPGRACELPEAGRLCVATACAHALTPKLGAGQHHPTRCAKDGIAAAPGFARVPGATRECARYDACLDLLAAVEDLEESIAASRGTEPRSRSCPPGCVGFAPAGRLAA